MLEIKKAKTSSSGCHTNTQTQQHLIRIREGANKSRNCSLQAFGDAAVRVESERYGEEEEERDPQGLTAVAALPRACQG